MRSAISPRLAISSFSIFIAWSADDDERLIELDRLAVADHDFPDGSAGRAVIGFITFIASTISKVSPAFTVVADLDERLAAGFGRRGRRCRPSAT